MDVQEVVECISHLDSHKAVGVDGILIKASPLSMAVLLTKLINKSISSAVLPIVTPIPKSYNGSSLSKLSSHFSSTSSLQDIGKNCL